MAEQNFLHQLTGCFSQGAAGNPTVAMIEAAYRHHDLPWRYINMEVAPAELGAAVAGARAMGFRGFNCSLPHKVEVIPHLDGLGASAAVMGAVNCVVKRDGRYVGENTDGKGFLKSLRETIDPAGQVVALYGAGGAARAIAVELALAGVRKIRVINRSFGRAAELVKLLQEQLQLDAEFVAAPAAYLVPPEVGILINATSIGSGDAEALPGIDLASLRPSLVVCDVICNPPRTRLLREAEARGCRVIDGLGMLVNQGVIGLQYWTGLEPDAAVMRRALEEIFGDPGPARGVAT